VPPLPAGGKVEQFVAKGMQEEGIVAEEPAPMAAGAA
jgi:hypothetical protein